MIRRLICCFFLFQLLFCQAQEHSFSDVWRVGFTQEFQKFDQFSSIRIQGERNKNMLAVNIGLSPQKVTQNIFAPGFSIDYAKLWKIQHVFIGPVIVVSADTHVFGTRFTYLHASGGYRFVFGKQWQFFQETSFGPTTETFTYLNQKMQHFTWNYHVNLGLQYALR
jgi:hypothetical protein